MVVRWSAILKRVTRTRPVTDSTSDEARNSEGLKKCLTTVDLVSLGVGSCCGSGMYLTCGMITKTAGGPGAVIAFLVAGLASLLSGICYAELASLCPKTSGSAYMYSYVTVGELIAYIIGWGLMAEYAIGTAAGAVALSATVDSMCNFVFSGYLSSWGHVGGRPYFDVLAMVICLVLTMVLVSGVELSATVNNILNLVNFVVFIFFIIVSFHYSDTDNWKAKNTFPTGAFGVVKMLPTAYFAFIGFDIVASTGEEAKNPTKSIPRSIIFSVIINIVAYTAISTCLSLVLPPEQLKSETAMVDVFVQKGALYAKYVISCGAVCGLLAAAFGSMFPLPRVLCAMAKDGLIFSCFGEICPKRKTPKTATMVTGVAAALLAVTVELTALIELVLMGTLLAYILVAVSVIVLRFSNDEIDQSLIETTDNDIIDVTESETLPVKQRNRNTSGDEKVKVNKAKDSIKREIIFTKFEELFLRQFGSLKDRVPMIVSIILVLEVSICLTLVHGITHLLQTDAIVVTILVVLVSSFVVLFGLLAVLPQTERKQGFRISFVPSIPLLVTLLNMYFMVSLSAFSWTLFAVWMSIGFIVYFTYSVRRRDEDSLEYTRLQDSTLS